MLEASRWFRKVGEWSGCVASYFRPLAGDAGSRPRAAIALGSWPHVTEIVECLEHSSLKCQRDERAFAVVGDVTIYFDFGAVDRDPL